MNNESTYSLLVQSEEKGRGLMEVGVFSLIALSGVLAICQFAQQAESLPLGQLMRSVTEHGEIRQIAS